MTRLNYLLGLLFILGSLTSSAQLNVQIKAGDRQICVDETITFNDSIVSGTPTSYEWISTVATFSSASSNSTAATFSGSGDVILKTVDGSSTFYDTVFVKVNLLPRTVLRDRTFCQDFGCIDLSETVVISPANINIGTPSWRCLDSNSAVNQFSTNMLESRGSSFVPDWWLCFNEDNYTIQNSDKDTIVLEFTYENEYGCTTKDTVNIEIWRVPKIIFSSHRDLCWDEGKISLNALTSVNLTDGAWTIYDSTGFRLASTLGGLTGDTINTLNSVPLASTNANPKSYLIRYDHVATGCPASNDTTLTIYPLPVVNLTQPNPNRYCETAANMPLTANPAGGTWSSNDPSAIVGGNTFSPGNASRFYPDDISLFYDYTSPITGCSATDSMSISIDASPTITTPTDTEFCRTRGIMTETLQFAVTGQNTDRILWFNFNPGAPRVTMGTVASQNITLNYQAESTDVFRIIISAEGRGSCADVGRFFDITVHPIPQATLTNDNPEGCNPVTTTLGVNITNQVDPTTSNYAWTLGDAGNTTASTASTTITYTTDGQPRADLTITSDQGCDTTLSTTTRVNPIPVARFTINPNNNTPVTLPRFSFINTSTVSTTNGAMITDYAWDFGDSAGTTSTDQNVTFFYPPDTATYQVNITVTTNHGCSDVYGYPVHVGKPGAVSVGSLAQEDLIIYPNPSAGTFTIENANLYNITVFDVLGKRVNAQVTTIGSLTIAAKGVYMLQLQEKSSGIVYSKKVIVE